jgi:hypothetical protein
MWKRSLNRLTEGVILSGKETASGRTSGETIEWRRRGIISQAKGQSLAYSAYACYCFHRGQPFRLGLFIKMQTMKSITNKYKGDLK